MGWAMGKEMPGTEEDTRWRKVISRQRDRAQSLLLVWVMTPLLVCGGAVAYRPLIGETPEFALRVVLFPFLFSFGFAALVWAARSATLPAAGIGLLVCLILARAPGTSMAFGMVPALIVLFALTFVATRFGRAAKEKRGLAEARSGRRASQIVANLGVAALCASVGWTFGCVAALAEAAADTVSSEVGQAFGGRAWLVTTFRRVPAGKDGGMSLAGTFAGMGAAALTVWAACLPQAFWPLFASACAGLVFDSVLGATVEQRGWIGNDLVNFTSTLFAAAVVRVWMTVC
jgi:uncharacterized protein (TIGR00297 family)